MPNLPDDRRLNLLFVCSRNQWRSPTAERVYANDPRFAVRSRGVSPHANQRLSERDIEWSDVIFAMENEHRARILGSWRSVVGDRPIVVLDIPDDYRFMDPELVELIRFGVEDALAW